MRIIASLAFCLLLSACTGYSQDQGPGHVATPVIIETEGYTVPQDSLIAPIVIPLDESSLPRSLAGKPTVMRLESNVQPSGEPSMITAGTPMINTPGHGSFKSSIKVLAAGRDEPVNIHEVVVAKDMDSKGNGQYSFTYSGVLQGLKCPDVHSIMQDNIGNLWFCYCRGVSRYDGTSYTHYNISQSAKYHAFVSIYQDRSGNVWLGSGGNGVYKYNGKTFTQFAEAQGLAGNHVNSIIGDRNGNIWFAVCGGVSRYDGQFLTNFTAEHGFTSECVFNILEDRKGQLWFSTSNGIFSFDGESFTHFTSDQGLPSDYITDGLEDDDGSLWFSSNKGIFNFNGTIFTSYTTAQGLASNIVTQIHKDHSGNLWLTTPDRGVDKFELPSSRNRGLITNFNEEHGLSSNHVRCAFEDDAGNLWFGTDAGISRLAGNAFTHYTKALGFANINFGAFQDRKGNYWINNYTEGVYRSDGQTFHRFGREQGLRGGNFQFTREDKEGNIWFATEEGLSRYDGRYFTYLTTEEGLPSNFVIVILEDKAGNMWFGTQNGVVKYDRKSLTVFSRPQGLASETVNNLFEDREGNIWFGTVTGGVTRYTPPTSDRPASFTQFTEAQGLSNNLNNGIVQDKAGNMWFVTRNGISVYDGNSMIQFTTAQGLPDNDVTSILADRVGNLWFGTRVGLSCLTSDKWDLIFGEGKFNTNKASDLIFRNYTYEDGFMGVGCKPRAIFEALDGDIWVSAYDRLTVYHPEGDLKDTSAPIIQLTDLELFNEKIAWPLLDLNRDSSFTLGNGVSVDGLIFDSLSNWYSLPVNPSFAHNNNFLTFDFIGITAYQPKKVQYQFKLEGLDGYWSAPTTDTYANYGNLSPGNYTFKVKGKSSTGKWSSVFNYPLTVRPPWWLTWWAYMIYAFMGISLLLAVRYFEIRRVTYRSEARRLKELDNMKSKLYANITHEFRTPLTVIMGMSDNIKGHPQERNLIRRNSTKLLQLINQMLDLSRVDTGAMKPQNRQADIIAYLNYLVESFYSLAREKEIHLTFYSEQPELIMDYDEEKLQHVVYNLLSNAIKFTGPKGKVVLHTRKVCIDDNPQLHIKVQDSGKGIPEESIPYIFDRFYQVDDSTTRSGEGSGIGLALTKEYVELMGGSIDVTSVLGSGSEFLVILPVSNKAPFQNTQVSRSTLTFDNSILTLEEEPQSNEGHDKPVLLIVEDNHDVVTYIRSIVSDGYHIETASNGKVGLEKAISLTPDVIVSDVMMPEMDGYELTQRVKADERTSHIPIVLLTAKVEEHNRIEGLQRGADAYLTKPFNKTELLLRLENLRALSDALRIRYSGLEPAEDNDGGVTIEDEFLRKVLDIVDQNLASDSFTVAAFCRAVGMSQSQLYRKLMALTGRSPSEFIRTRRLDKAADLLKTTDLNISEIAWESGFSDPNYFSRAFNQKFSMSPTDWRKEQ